MHDARIIHLAQVCVDLTLSVDHLPERGGDVFATGQGISAGGGYNVLYAARQMGAPTTYMGALGTGPMADIARAALEKIGVDFEGAVLPDIDTGYSVAMTEPSGERTFVSTRGAETMVPVDYYENIDLIDGDVVYLCGYSLVHASNAEAIRRFARRHAGWANGRVLFDTSPVIGDIASDDLERVRMLDPIWSANEREAGVLCQRFGLRSEGLSDERRCAELAGYLHDLVIVRVGPQGAWYCDGRNDSAVSAALIPAPHVEPVDTNGAGDCHAGVLCAALLEGRGLPESLLLANRAAALSTTASGPATCPPRALVLAGGGQSE